MHLLTNTRVFCGIINDIYVRQGVCMKYVDRTEFTALGANKMAVYQVLCTIFLFALSTVHCNKGKSYNMRIKYNEKHT